MFCFKSVIMWCWVVWIEQREAAAGYIRWILAFISSRLSCSLLRFTCCRWLHAHLLLVFISGPDLPPFSLRFICLPLSLPTFSPPSPPLFIFLFLVNISFISLISFILSFLLPLCIYSFAPLSFPSVWSPPNIFFPFSKSLFHHDHPLSNFSFPLMLSASLSFFSINVLACFSLHTLSPLTSPPFLSFSTGPHVVSPPLLFVSSGLSILAWKDGTQSLREASAHLLFQL